MRDFRCKFCHKLLFKAVFKAVKLEIKCGKCKKLNVILTGAGGYDSDINVHYKGNTFIPE